MTSKIGTLLTGPGGRIKFSLTRKKAKDRISKFRKSRTKAGKDNTITATVVQVKRGKKNVFGIKVKVSKKLAQKLRRKLK